MQALSWPAEDSEDVQSLPLYASQAKFPEPLALVQHKLQNIFQLLADTDLLDLAAYRGDAVQNSISTFLNAANGYPEREWDWLERTVVTR